MNIYGYNPVIEAIENNKDIRAVYIKRGKIGKEGRVIINLCKEKGIPYFFKDKFFFKKEKRNYWIIAETSPVPLIIEEEFFKDQKEEILIFLYKIQDPQNLGNLLRSAVGFGFYKIALTLEGTAPISDVVSRASEGAINFIKIINIKKPLNFLKNAKERGFKIYGGTMEGEPLEKIKIERKSIFILGSEGKGIPKEVKGICDKLVSIPLKGKIKSLNVSTAGGIFFYELSKRF